MKKFCSLNIIFALILLTLSYCSPKRGDSPRSSLPPIQDINYVPDLLAPEATDFGITLRTTESWAYPNQPAVDTSETAACNFWNQLTLTPDDEVFQIVDNLQLVKGSTHRYYGVDHFHETFTKDAIIGRHVPERLPHMLYFLSKENDEERFVETLNKLHNPPTADEVREYVSKHGSFKERNFVWIKSDEDLIKERNKKIVESLEKIMPGVYTGISNGLAGKIAFETLEPFVGVTQFDRRHFKALSVLAQKVPLFKSSKWVDREYELRQTLAILDRDDTEALSFEEKVCQFAIYHRIVAQLIRLKGVQNAPLLSHKGTLAPLPLLDRDTKTGKPLPLPAMDIPGLFQEKNKLDEWVPVVVTNEWVSQKVSAIDDDETDVHIRIKDPLDLQEKLAALRYLVTLTAYRSNQLFDVFPDAPDSRPRILKKLQKMGIAMFALTLHTLKEREFPIGEGIDMKQARFRFLKEDSADNLAYLLHTVIEAYESLERLKTAPTAEDRELLSLSQLETFAGTEDKEGVVDSLAKLQLILVVESKFRLDRGEGSQALKHALDRAVLHSQLNH